MSGANPFFRSHKTTVLTNYFDDKDSRVRDHAWTLDAQLLNASAMLLEYNDVKIRREVESRFIEKCPLNLDNSGVYYRSFIPSSFQLPVDATGSATAPKNIRAVLPGPGGQTVSVNPYDDTLPIPARVSIDSKRSPIPYTDPVLFSFQGNDSPQEITDVQLNLPTKIWMVLSDLGNFTDPIEVTITGQPSPQPFSFDLLPPRVERIQMGDEGVFQSRLAWSSIESIVVRGLPTGASLQGLDFLFQTTQIPDPMRPFTHPAWRQQPFPRYWSFSGHLLMETYFRTRFSGNEYVQSYYCPNPLTAMCLEPNTYGLFAASGTTLYYIDRREPLPGFLSRTGIAVEPLYGLDVVYDITRPGDQRYVSVNAYPYDGWSKLVRYRILVETPSTIGTPTVLLPDGSFAPYGPVAGWRLGAPKPISVPVSELGTYIFTLEMLDVDNNTTTDIVPYGNFQFTPVANFDLSSSVPSINGIGFDHKQQLWIWTGTYLIPFVVEVDGYLFDPDSRALYFTQPYQSVQLIP